MGGLNNIADACNVAFKSNYRHHCGKIQLQQKTNKLFSKHKDKHAKSLFGWYEEVPMDDRHNLIWTATTATVATTTTIATMGD